jgi:putative addiction module component (TIGR02574 family)
VDLKSVLAEVDSWPVEDRIRLVHELWERLAVEGNDLELSDAAKAEIDRRLAAHASEPEAAISWEEVEADALSRIRR